MRTAELDDLSRQQIINRLKKGMLTVTFEKSNGEERTMHCTLAESMVPKTSTDHNKGQDEVIVAYDLDKKAWRSFRYDSILRIQ